MSSDARERAERIAERFVTESSTLPLPEHGNDCLNELEQSIVKELAGYIASALAAREGEEKLWDRVTGFVELAAMHHDPIQAGPTCHEIRECARDLRKALAARRQP